MATFELISDSTYRVEGTLTQEDVERINAFKIRTNLILQNTKGQSSEIISKINTDNVCFSILGGLDYFEKQKYNNKSYIERTQSSPKGLTKILQYFEKIESEMAPDWTDTQKCMYAYNTLAVDTEYVKDLEQDILSAGVTERGLNGILYNQLTCAGMAKTFKEMMDRLGIKCYYQNQKSVHAFNVVELEGKLRGIDVTWDCTKTDEKKCSFENFGRDTNFYQRYGHQIEQDDEEVIYDLTPFTDQEISNNYAVIEDAVNSRDKMINSFRNFDRDKRRKFLPIDKFKEELEEEGKNLIKLRVLKQIGIIPQEVSEMIEATKGRYGFVSDYVGERNQVSRLNLGLNEIPLCNGLNGHLIMKDNQVLLVSSLEGQRVEEELTQKQCNVYALLEDVKEYYTRYFIEGASQIDDMIESLYMLDNMPAEVHSKTATLRAHLFTKMQLFSNADEFFGKIGIPKEEIESVSGKAKSYFNESREKSEGEPTTTKHENDLDFLYAIIQNDIIDTILDGGIYSEENFTRLMSEVRSNWTDSEFSDDEFRKLLNETLGKVINPEQISEATIKSEITRREINGVVQEIRQTQIKDLQVAQEK